MSNYTKKGKKVVDKLNVALFVSLVCPPRRSGGWIWAWQKYTAPALLQLFPEPTLAKPMALSEPNSKTKQTPDVGAVRRSGQNDNNNPSSEMMSQLDRKRPLPLHPLAGQRETWGTVTHRLWFGWNVITFLGCSKEWISCDKYSKEEFDF